MTSSNVRVRWKEGLHLRPAAQLVKLAQTFRSTIILNCGGESANMRSILSVVALCASAGTPIEVVAEGDDEIDALAAVQNVFSFDLPVEPAA
jgi:phosphocarrier protein HPr